MSNTVKKVVEPMGVPTAETRKVEVSTAMAIVPKDEPRKITADEKIERAQRFAILTKRYDLLLYKKNELEKFTLSNDGLNGLVMKVENGNRNEFSINNPVVIGELLAQAQTKLNSLVDECAKDVLAFEI
jgi:hypothetical protein